jgi:hypothetical protein
MERDDVESYVEGRVLYATSDGGRVSQLIKDVLLLLPSAFEPPWAIIVADGSTVYHLNYPHTPHLMANGKICVSEDLWVIVLQGSICEESDSYVRGVIAHELAHYWLKHQYGGKEKEEEAYELASEWGFANEIDAIRNDSAKTQGQ